MPNGADDRTALRHKPRRRNARLATQLRAQNRGPDHVPRSMESKTLRDCSNGSEVTPSWFPKGWSSQ